MPPHAPLAIMMVASAMATLLAVSASAQYVEVPPFTVAVSPGDFRADTSDVTAADDGGFVAVWQEYLSTDHTAPRPQAIVNRRVTPSGSTGLLVRRERSTNTTRDPTIARLGRGYLEAWIEHQDGTRLVGARLDEDGARLDEFEITDADGVEWLGREVAIAAIDLGAVVLWYESLRTPTGVIEHVVARIFDTQGRPRGPSVEVGSGVLQPYLDVVALPDGGFVVGWGGATQGNPAAFGRAYYADGQPRGEQFVFSTETQFRRLEVSADGATLAMAGIRPVALTEPRRIWVGRYTVDGTPLAAEFLAHPADEAGALSPDIAFDLAGNLYVTWIDGVAGVYARGFDPTDTPFGPPVTVSTEPPTSLRTARLASGSFVNVWNRSAEATVRAMVVSLCTPGTSLCGDGVVASRCELCDEGAANSDVAPDACRTDCRPARCGDGVIDGGEGCDDGNRDDCDGCSPTCGVETGLGCGDGVPYPACGEQCDDANATTGDGCSPTCTHERIRGGGASVTDCLTEWSVANPANTPLLEKGGFRRTQICTEGDPRCDFDGAADRCTFRVRGCANNTDVAGCVPGTRLSSWTLRQPSASQASKQPLVAAARAALAAAIPSSIVGPSERDVCSAPAEVPVGLRGAAGNYRTGKLGVKTTVTQYDGSRDTDTLKLICLP